MKKNTLLILAAILILVGIAAFFLLSSSEKTPIDIAPDQKKTEQVAKDKDKTDQEDKADEEDKTDEEISAEIPEVTVEDIEKTVLSQDDTTKRKFIIPEQTEELDAATTGASRAVPKKHQTFTLDWASTDFSSVLPDLPKSAPIYLLDRPGSGTVYDSVVNMGEKLGIPGNVRRMNESDYSIVDFATGIYYANYDLMDLSFTADNVAIKSESPEETLVSAGLLSFPHTSAVAKEEENGKWYRFSPDMPLPILNLGKTDDTFIPGMRGYVDAFVKDGNIVDIRSGFPNVTEKETADIIDSENLSSALEGGTFERGSVELQYSGAVTTKEKQAFFPTINEPEVKVSKASLSKLECGYLLDNDKTLQALLAPVCIAKGKGEVSGHAVLFQMVVPAVQ